jgi:predicted O-methyltransferase YrrM
MPTAERRQFVSQAIEYFMRQDYSNRELIVVDDGEDAVADLMPDDERVRYFRLAERRTVGAKRNFACEQARGQLIAHWDDDDWHAPHRLSYQLEALLRERADVCGINTLLFYDAGRARGWKYDYPPNMKMWLSGSTLCYTREFWESNRFANVNVGEDARFVWSSRTGRIIVLPDSTFHVGIIHQHNVSPKRTSGPYWRSHPLTQIRALMGDDWLFYHPEEAPAVVDMTASASVASVVDIEAAASASPLAVPVEEEARVATLRNVYACLVHEREECVVDLVRNLSYHDPASVILLYNGGNNPALLKNGFPFEQYGAVVHPCARPMRWGWLHDFALDSMRFSLENFSFDTLTIVDSDQLSLRSGYSDYLGRHLADQAGVGMLCNSPAPQPRQTRVAPAIQALREIELWRPFLRRFEGGEAKFVHWSFWPSTVFTADAARELTQLFSTDKQLLEIMSGSKIWATEEIIFPTLVALLGYRLAANPCSYDYVRYRARYSVRQLDEAFTRRDVFWMHPVPRQYGDPLRKQIRARFDHYENVSVAEKMSATPPPSIPEGPRLLLNAPILAQMRQVEGWLDDAEADLLIAAASHALKALPEPHAIVEVGSYCGRATVVLGQVARIVRPEAQIYSIDPHDGKVGALDQGIVSRGPTLEKFKRNMQRAGLARVVEVIQKRAVETDWERPISLLLIDGLHDYASVAQDFHHFERWVVPEGIIAFHDYAAYYPGVQAFVDGLLGSGRYRKVHCEKSMMVIQKIPDATADDADRSFVHAGQADERLRATAMA